MKRNHHLLRCNIRTNEQAKRSQRTTINNDPKKHVPSVFNYDTRTNSTYTWYAHTHKPAGHNIKTTHSACIHAAPWNNFNNHNNHIGLMNGEEIQILCINSKDLIQRWPVSTRSMFFTFFSSFFYFPLFHFLWKYIHLIHPVLLCSVFVIPIHNFDTVSEFFAFRDFKFRGSIN